VKILFISARFPYPPLRGDQVRAYHQLRLLGPKHRITLLSLTEESVSSEARQVIGSYCEQVITLPLRWQERAGGLLRNILSPYPLQTLIYQNRQMRQLVQQTLRSQPYDLAHAQLARMAPYLEQEQNIPRVIDLIDALSLNMQRRYLHDRSPLKWAAYIEWKRLSRYEQLICQTFEQVTVVSPTDYQAVGAYPNLTINPIGVDLNRFPFFTGKREPYTILFSGNMGYFPNEQAVLWFAQQVLPQIKATIPQVKFYIVGARPTRAVRQLAQEPNIIVTGFVEDVGVYLRQAAIAIAPVQAGSGIQIKVIEAMACGAPIVATPVVLGGIAAIEGEHVLVADTPDVFARQVCLLLRDPSLARYLAGNARCLVEERYTWERSVAQLEAIYKTMSK
jgi:polysaccharide biosynthesis protein PslH